MIDRALADFLEGGVAIHIGTRNERLEPNGTRAVAAAVEDDGRHVIVYVAKVGARHVMADLESNGQAAVVFSRPTDERTCQVKGVFVSARAATRSERPRIQAQWDRYFDAVEQIGIPRDGGAEWTIWPALAIRLKATALFDQTPGPQAGAPLQ